jgi:hypothetical protein
MAQSLLLEEFGSVPSAGRRTHPKAAAHPSHKVWPVLPASRCSTSCTPAISATVFSIVGLHAACRRSGWCNTGTAPEVCAPVRRESWRETGAIGWAASGRSHSHRAMPETACSARDPTLRQSASSDAPQVVGESYRANHGKQSVFTHPGPRAAG